MPLASKTFTDEATARRAMRRLIGEGYDKAGVRLRRPMNGDSFEVSVDVDGGDTHASRLLEEALGAPMAGQISAIARANPVGAMAAAFVGGYVAHLLIRR
jgi:hypothetical protein